MMSWRRTALSLAAAFCLSSAGGGGAEPPRAESPSQPKELAVEAAFLTRFAAYVDWPASLRMAPDAPITLCILGDDPFGRMIDEAARGRWIDRHPIVLKRIPGPAGADACQVAFVAGDAAHDITSLLGSLRGKPVLTVTDARAGPERGMIHFVIDQGRVRFQIDRAAAEGCSLGFDSRLLAIALSVRTSR